ncbi:MAG: acyl carrier protein [Phycisphaerae bacterium]|nr:acyl carrier protein [Phycisphaerae bacterium]
MELEHDIRTFVVENFLLGGGDGLSSSQSLLDAGVIDSTGVLELVSFLEKTYRIQIDDEDLVPENLDSISSIAQFVKRKLAAQDAA